MAAIPKVQEPSMEEILASIRRIMAEICFYLFFLQSSKTTLESHLFQILGSLVATATLSASRLRTFVCTYLPSH